MLLMLLQIVFLNFLERFKTDVGRIQGMRSENVVNTSLVGYGHITAPNVSGKEIHWQALSCIFEVSENISFYHFLSQFTDLLQ